MFSRFQYRLRRFLSQHSTKVVVVLLAIGLLGITRKGLVRVPFLALPGTQPGQSIGPFDAAQTCKGCHYQNDSSRTVMISKEWAGSMMAHSARDPIFYAALAVLNKYHQGDGEYCIRCHSPTGWLVGHSELFTGQALTGTDLDGVQCDYCHRLVDPMNPDSTVITPPNPPVPGYGNAMHVIENLFVYKRGPFSDALEIHKTLYDPFQTTGNFCGVCHDVSNPNRITPEQRSYLPPHAYGPLERTYSEWLMSSYAQRGSEGTCQSCHMKDTTGYACIYAEAQLRTNLARHDLTGGNTFVPDILPDFYTGLDTEALALGKVRATATLRRAANLDVVSYHSGDSVLARVRITNLTGHKLPTGYPDGRRMWINLIALDLHHDTVFQSGVYDFPSAILQEDSYLKVYEAVHGLTADSAARYGLPAGPSFHFFLNDTIFKDNRIPPEGFTNSGFAERLAEPVGTFYIDSQYWDETRYTLPSTAANVIVTIYYQTISKEYVEFLRDQNVSNSYDWNNWGGKLYDSWNVHGKSQPVVMKTSTVPVKDSIDAVVENDPSLPTAFMLMQNYPNPFNPTTTVSFVISHSSPVALKVFDIVGNDVATIVQTTLHSGSYSFTFDGSNFPNGVYLYRLSVNGRSLVRKMVLIK